jgi:hypothetical protein
MDTLVEAVSRLAGPVSEGTGISICEVFSRPQGPVVVSLFGGDRQMLSGVARRLCRAVGGPTSRSYHPPLALVAFHHRRVGVDVEGVEETEVGFFEGIATPLERSRLALPPAGPQRDRFLISLWSAKEAVAKTLGDALSYDPRRLDSPLVWEEVSPGLYRAGSAYAQSLPLGEGLVGWVCWS